MMINFLIDSETKKTFGGSYSIPSDAKERYIRKKKRAAEIGIKLFVLDEDDAPVELLELENLIVDEYLDEDLDVPEELAQKYKKLKTEYENKTS